jgi:hypothetical protein
MVNAFSFCLYGTDTRLYHRGFLENLELVKRYYPGWIVYVYLGTDVAPEFREYFLRDPIIRVRDTGTTGAVLMIHRFFAIDEPDVDVCFFRDADSRIHWKDRWAINDFMRSNYNAHVIRDNVQHTAMIMGGLWALRRNALKTSMRSIFEGWTPVYAGNGHPDKLDGHGMDQNFLLKTVYPLVQSTLLVHYSFKHLLYPSEKAVQFPFTWTNDIYCGRVELSVFSDSNAPPAPFKLPSVFVKLSHT